MPQNWKTYKLSELTSVITKGTTPSTYGFDFEKSGINFIKAESLNYDGKVDAGVFAKISQQAHEKLKRSQLQESDILFSMAGAYLGKVGMVKKEYCPANTNQAVGIIRIDHPEVLPKFVEFALRNPSNVAYVNSLSGQSAQPNINLAEIGSLSFRFPPLPIQRSIASILRSLDDKIELNLEMNKTLEEMAMTLYKHWFVDFGPFKDGNFVESELGMIPEGWQVKGVLEIANLLSGGTPKTKIKEYWNGSIKWVSAKDIGNNGSIYINSTEKSITELGVSKSAAKILPQETVIVVARGSVGKYGMIAQEMAMNQSCYGIFTKCDFSQSLIYLTISQLMEQLKRMSYGSVFDTITTSTFESTKIVKPPVEIVEKLKLQIDPLFELIKNLTIENQRLSKIRDTLLPKLISGEIEVIDTEEEVSYVV